MTPGMTPGSFVVRCACEQYGRLSSTCFFSAIRFMPKRFLFTSAPLAGHLDWGGYLKTAVHLSHLGHETLWVSEKPIAPSVEALGLRFQPVQASGWHWPEAQPTFADREDVTLQRLQRALDTALSEEAIALAT